MLWSHAPAADMDCAAGAAACAVSAGAGGGGSTSGSTPRAWCTSPISPCRGGESHIHRRPTRGIRAAERERRARPGAASRPPAGLSHCAIASPAPEQTFYRRPRPVSGELSSSTPTLRPRQTVGGTLNGSAVASSRIDAAALSAARSRARHATPSGATVTRSGRGRIAVQRRPRDLLRRAPIATVAAATEGHAERDRVCRPAGRPSYGR